MTSLRMTPGTKIKALRDLKGMSQTDLVNELCARFPAIVVTRDQLAGWEVDRHYPRWEQAKALVRYFGITLDDLFFEDRTGFLPKKSSLKKQGKVKAAVR